MPRTGSESEEAYWDDLAARLREVIDRFRAPMSSEAELKYLEAIIGWLEEAEGHYAGTNSSFYGSSPDAFPTVVIEHSTMSAKEAAKHDRQLVSDEPEHIRRARHALTAEIMLFGRSLIEAGKKSLPVEAVMAAHKAKQAKTLGAFWDAAKEARYALDFNRWANRHRLLRDMEDEVSALFEQERGERREKSPMMVLPHIFGRFPDSPMRPNCLGAAILAASWCELASVQNYVYASLVQSDDEYHWGRIAQMWRRIFSFLGARGFAFEQGVTHHLREDIEMAEKIAQDKIEHSSLDPHACVAIGYTADRWMIMDNWLHKRFHIGTNEDVPSGVYSATMDDAVDLLNNFTEPGLTLSRRAWELDADWRTLEQMLDDAFTLTEALMAAHSSYDPTSEYDSLADYVDYLANALRDVDYRGNLFDWELLNTSISRDHIVREDPRGWTIYATLMHHLCYRYAHAEGVAEEDMEGYESQLRAAYDKDAEVARRIRYDLVTMPLREVMAQVASHLDQLNKHSKAKSISEQPVLEFGRPSIQFGCAALAHLIAWDDWTAARLRLADLLHFTTSQAIAYDAITELHFEADNRLWGEAFAEEILHAEQGGMLTFAQWLVADGRNQENLLVFPGDVQLVGPQAAVVLRAWKYLENMPSSLQHRQAKRLLERIQQSATRQSRGSFILVTRERTAHGA